MCETATPKNVLEPLRVLYEPYGDLAVIAMLLNYSAYERDNLVS